MNKGKKKYKTITGRYFYERPDQGIRNLIGVINGLFIIAGLSFISASFNSNEISNEIEVQAEEIVMFGDKQEVLEVELIESEPIEEILTEGTTIEDYIKYKFGDDWKVALAIARAESGLNPLREGIHDAYSLPKVSPTYPGECSIGLFQVNLASDGCKGRQVHATRIPGEDLGAKIEWLKDYKNNVDYAYKLYEVQGFNPWSTYKTGLYKKYL